MPLFQQSVLKKYVNDLNKEKLQAAWQRFHLHFQNALIQQNILNAKEEEYQEGFVRDLFVNVLDYTLKPQPDYNLVMEQKSTSDATKSDGAVLSAAGNVTAVIELKDTGTTDLGKVEKQAFGYKHQHKDCIYVIIANFAKLRLYISDSIDFEEFDLFRMGKEEFAILYCCLQQQALAGDTPLKMKQQSIAEEQNVTKKLYSDYSRFKKQLFTDITNRNSQYDKLELFKKTQKLLDRFLFILFAEDRLLLPPNSVRDILKQWEQLKELDNYVPLYDRFKKYFGYLNTGYQGKQYEIFAYNGGLFAQDETLDGITVDDQLLYDSCRGLSDYDFESEVDVNILGHIFEHSLSEIEEVERELTAPLSVGEGLVSKPTSKRKRDGVFYTPRYITKYIVENTIGVLCTQKKEELQIIDDAFTPQKRKANTQQLLQKLEAYRQWLLQLTICDPACGSGAFLNQALEFLIAEHQRVDEMTARLFGDALVLSDVEASILENNLYGVDINDEATEIAKLSLWLRTARKGRKLNNLNKHIKCGNSLIDDPVVAGDKAFNWQQEFPEVFVKGGFDVVIGNPPYVDVKNLPNEISRYLFFNYQTTENRINLYSTFIEKGISLLKPHGLISFINPNSMLVNSSYKKLRELMIDSLLQVIKLPDNVFSEAKVETMIFILKKETHIPVVSTLSYGKDEIINSIDYSRFMISKKAIWISDPSLNFNLYLSYPISKITSKIEENSVSLLDYCDFSLGITPYDKYKGHTELEISNRSFHSKVKLNEFYKPLIAGENIIRYYTLPHIEEYIKYGSWLGRPREERFFLNERIIARQIISGNPPRIYASYANESYYFTHHGFGMIPNEKILAKYLLVILNSKLINFYHTFKFLDIEKRLFQKFLIENCKKLPIKIISKDDQLPFIAKADIMLSKSKELQQLKHQLLQLLKGKYEGLTLSKKQQDWPSLSFKDFLKELEKQKIKLSLTGQAEWMQYFEAEKAKANSIQQLINATDKEIDDMVYELYGLTDEERKIVEEG